MRRHFRLGWPSHILNQRQFLSSSKRSSKFQDSVKVAIHGVAFLAVMVASQGCYHYRISPTKFDPATEYKSATVHGLFWGAAQSPKILYADNCVGSNRLDEVRMTTNLGYSLLTVATLGIWCPMKVEWKCAKPCQREGEL